MAMAKVMLTGAFLLALIFSYAIISTEERKLLKTEISNIVAEEDKSVQEKDFSSSHARIMQSKVSFPKENHSNIINSSSDNEVVQETGEGDDFRSTTPGRSPGVGHKF